MRFVPTRGSRLVVKPRDKKTRIAEALTDLQLVTAGAASAGEGRRDANGMAEMIAAVARSSSVFLRKLVLGEPRNPKARLLDEGVLASLNMRLQPLRKIPTKGRRNLETGFTLDQALFIATRLDETTGEPLERYGAIGGPQGWMFHVEWPLPGMAGWTDVPADGHRWPISAGQLFDIDSDRDMQCDDWLAQQVVIFDGKGIALHELIRAVANYDGAHAIGVGRLAVVEGETPTEATKHPDLHLLKNITFFGIGYAHLVVVEAAMYLYERLVDEASIARPRGDILLVRPEFECSAEQAASSSPDWMRFRGGATVSFSSRPGVMRHTVRAVGRRRRSRRTRGESG